MANDLIRNVRFDRFDKRGIYCRRGRFRHIYQLLIRNRDIQAARDGGSPTAERAVQDLKGGLTSTVEGLEDSGPPCTQVLSVAGFYALIAGFPGRRKFILRERKNLSSRAETSLLQPPD